MPLPRYKQLRVSFSCSAMAVQEMKTTYTYAERLVLETLRPIRFNGGRGYYFAVTMQGVEKLYPVAPELEGRNLLDLQDAKGNFTLANIAGLFTPSILSAYWITIRISVVTALGGGVLGFLVAYAGVISAGRRK